MVSLSVGLRVLGELGHLGELSHLGFPLFPPPSFSWLCFMDGSCDCYVHDVLLVVHSVQYCPVSHHDHDTVCAHDAYVYM